MSRVPRWRLVTAIVVALLATLAAVVYALHKPRGLISGPCTSSQTIARIPAPGAQLTAQLTTAHGPGPHGLVVMPSSWALDETQYQFVADLFASRCFDVVAYTQRGFRNSTGRIDFAGPRTVDDVSTVIDWALAHTDADSSRIGMLGTSYGGGVALLAAEHDPRIKAVVALSTWTDWAGSFDQNDTLSRYNLNVLLANVAAQQWGRLDRTMASLEARVRDDGTSAQRLVRTLSPERSPITHVAALNRNHTAVMLANGWQDALLPPGQLVRFYDELTGPKRLELKVGDHQEAEYTGFFGHAVGPVGDGLAWLEHYLDGLNTGIQSQPPVQLDDSTTKQTIGYAAFPTKLSPPVDLARPNSGSTAGTRPGTWTATIAGGADTVADAPPQHTDFKQPYPFAQVSRSKIDPGHGFVWSLPPVPAEATFTGSAHVRLNVTSSTSTASLFFYLYDVNSSGTGRLMSVTPDTVTGLSLDKPERVDLTLQPMSWTTSAGDHIALVVDTVDPYWTSATPARSTVTVSSSTSTPVELQLPELR